MATMTCDNCPANVDPGDPVCRSCGFPAPARQADTTAPTTRHGGVAPNETMATPPVAATPCDHSGSKPDAVICTVCGNPRTATDIAATDRRRRAILSFPWGDHIMVVGEVVDVGREVGPFERFLEPYLTVGRRHASLRLTGSGALLVRDHDSTNGTFVDGTRCESTGEVEVSTGAELRFSSVVRVLVRFE